MSEQSKSNLQAIAAGLLGFAAVVAVGGGALLLHNKLASRSVSAPLPAAAPIDLGSSLPRPGSVTPAERRESSPAPIVGGDEEGVQAAPSEARAGAPASSPAARAAAERAAEGSRSAPALKASEHLTAEASTTAEAKVAKASADEKAVKVKHVRGKAAPAAGAQASDGAAGGDAAVASVHYGVKSRNELMGRAAGPVYNFTGGAAKGGTTAGAGKVAGNGSIDASLAELKKKLQSTELPPEQRAAILKQLEQADGAGGGVEDAPR